MFSTFKLGPNIFWGSLLKRSFGNSLTVFNSNPSNKSNDLLKQPLMIYLHWPYCKSKCTYCNFNKYINPRPDHERMKKTLISEINHYVQKYDMKGRIIHSVYFGGGTPSLALPSTFKAVLNTIAKEFTLPSNVEITMEGNPTSTETKKLQEFHAIGINRLSLGLQSLNDSELKRLGRDHTSREAIDALKESQKIFGENVTFDLIFGREGQTVEDWKAELMHQIIFLYMNLQSRKEHRKFKKPSPDHMANLYDTTLEITKRYGFQQYEVSNFQRNEKYSRHNYGYWSGLDYLGIGPGAHGRLTDSETGMRFRTIRRLYPEEWMSQCEETGEGQYEQMNLEDVKKELVLFGLRTKIGIPRARFRKYSSNQELEKNRTVRYDNNEWMLNDFREEVQDGGLRPTDKGLAVIDEIVPRIIY
ncbi:8904_t:CDS:10 [Funneliformis mosseae]|uniref:Radical S-adenosyl methionine domain-containing protein 1, mitochondrial n=1 Tax=Funneliformis mosseae TaxID=27381 RepID=A0A9N8ZV30_FUNMO|nr:8904_t:CDS:10 [Funneliformis mosseae]